jgi:hypothetical protein
MIRQFLALLCSCSLALAQGVTVIPKTTVAPNTTVFPGTSGGGVTWTLAQHVLTSCASTTACSGSGVANDTAGNLVVILTPAFGVSTQPTLSSFSCGTETCVTCPSQYAAAVNYSGSNWLATACAYVLSAVGGNQNFTASWTGSASEVDIEILEFHRSTGTASLETCSSCTATSTSCSTCTGPTPTVTGNASVAMQWAGIENSCTAISSPYNISPSPDFENVNVGGFFGWSLSQTSGNAASYTCTAGGAAMSAIAFK